MPNQPFKEINPVTVLDLGPFTDLSGKLPPNILQGLKANLEEARKNGLHPRSFSQVFQKYVPPSSLGVGNFVFFDTPRNRVSQGNHWQILSMDEENNIMLQHFDWKGQKTAGVSPIKVNRDTPFVTGFSTGINHMVITWFEAPQQDSMNS